MTNNSAVVFKSKYLSAYSEYDIQTAKEKIENQCLTE